MAEELDVRRHALEIEYNVEDEPVVVGNGEIQRVQRTRFALRADREFFQSCLGRGLAVAIVGATVYFLKDKFSLSATPLTSGSVIYDVTTPSGASERLKDLVASDVIREGLQRGFANITSTIKKIAGDKGIKKIEPEDLLTLKKLKIGQITLVDDSILKRAIFSAEDTAGTSKEVKNEPLTSKATQRITRSLAKRVRKDSSVSIVETKRARPEAPTCLTVARNPSSPNNSLVVFYQEPEEEVDSYRVTASNLSDESTVTFTSSDDCTVLNLPKRGSYLISVEAEVIGKYSRKVTYPQVVSVGMWEDSWTYDPSVSKDSGVELQDDDASSIAGSASELVHKDKPALHKIKSKNVQATGTGDVALWNSDIHRRLKMSLGEMTENKWKELLQKLCDVGFSSISDLKFLKDESILSSLSPPLNKVEILKLKEYRGSMMKYSWDEPPTSHITVNYPRTIRNSQVSATKHIGRTVSASTYGD